MTNPRSLAAYYFWYFAAVGVFEPYLAPFWREAGFSPSQFGFLVALLPGVGIAAPFVWTAAADLTRRVQPIFLINTILCAAAAFLLPALHGFLPMVAAVLVFSLVRSPLIPIANSFTLRALAGSPERYAGVRLWGTIGYIAAAVLVGALMDRIGLARGIYGIGLAMLLCAVTAWLGRSREPLRLPRARLADIRQVLSDPGLQRLLLAGGLARLSFGPNDTFFSIRLEQLGLSRTFAGAAWALAAASELAVMLCWPRLCKVAGPRTWLRLALAAHAVRWALLAVAVSPAFLLAIQLTHALTFGAFYLAAVQEVDAAAPDGLRATAQGALSSVTFALGGFLGSTLSGLLYDPLGIRGLYLGACLVAVAAAVLYGRGGHRMPKVRA